ncbi:hypothetical protein ND973_13820 [Vibrio diabolicus]|uniref:hypothetical protein n=1 Tax=Vibrio parahaemolyticus TaxID=670 RepID=UPI0006A5BA00|nr:hypothetical protein ACX13_15185 [Vibrio parahaemolyticus]MCS0328189.1 hypothetical protein [Vibrio diabolicus]
MFKNADHAKKATKSIFDFSKANPKAKLSEFREFLASRFSYNTFHDLLNNVSAPQEAKEIPFLDLLFSDYAVFVNNTSFGRVFIMPDSIIINYDVAIDKNGLFTDEKSLTIPLSHIKKAKIVGSKVFLKDDCDELVEMVIYLPMNSHQVKITTNHDLITVRKSLDSGETEEYSFSNDRSGEYMAKEKFKNLLESSVSNFDEYSKDDIDALWESGSESFGTGKIEVIYELDSDDDILCKGELAEIKIAFDIESASVSQMVQIINDNYDENSIIEGLKSDKLCVTTFHNQSNPDISVVDTGEKVAIVLSQEIQGKMRNIKAKQ